MYKINPYAFATAIVGALQVEIKKREELEKEVFLFKKHYLN